MTKRTPRVENAILDGIAAGRPLDALCRRHGVSPSTVYHAARVRIANARRNRCFAARRRSDAAAQRRARGNRKMRTRKRKNHTLVSLQF